MADVLTQGPQGPRSRWRTGIAAASAVILLALAGVLWVTRAAEDSPAAPPSPAAPGGPTPTADRPPLPRLTGEQAGTPLGFGVLLSGGPLLARVTAGGDAETITVPGLGPGQVVEELLRVRGGTVVVVSPEDASSRVRRTSAPMRPALSTRSLARTTWSPRPAPTASTPWSRAATPW